MQTTKLDLYFDSLNGYKKELKELEDYYEKEMNLAIVPVSVFIAIKKEIESHQQRINDIEHLIDLMKINPINNYILND